MAATSKYVSDFAEFARPRINRYGGTDSCEHAPNSREKVPTGVVCRIGLKGPLRNENALTTEKHDVDLHADGIRAVYWLSGCPLPCRRVR
jgi:hypothetical protein